MIIVVVKPIHLYGGERVEGNAFIHLNGMKALKMEQGGDSIHIVNNLFISCGFVDYVRSIFSAKHAKKLVDRHPMSFLTLERIGEKA